MAKINPAVIPNQLGINRWNPGLMISRSISKWIKVKTMLYLINRLNLRMLDEMF